MEQSNNETQVLSSESQVPAQEPQAPETKTQTQDTGIKGAIEATVDKVAGETPVDAYTPNWKFKVLDKEHEVEEWLRPVVKDADSEKKIKELYEKAYGLDPVKASRDAVQKELAEVKKDLPTLTAVYNDAYEAMQFKHRGDLAAFFEKVGVTDEQLAKYMLEKINRQNLPPEQQQVYNELEAKRKSEYQQARQLEEMDQRYQQMATQAREWEVDQWLAKPEVSGIAERYDAVNGKGTFKRHVAEIGVQYHAMNGQDPSVEQVMSIAMDNWKKLEAVFRNQPVSNAPPAQNNQEKPLPVIPNVSGKNVSPTRKAVRSIDDLRKLRNEALNS